MSGSSVSKIATKVFGAAGVVVVVVVPEGGGAATGAGSLVATGVPEAGVVPVAAAVAGPGGGGVGDGRAGGAGEAGSAPSTAERKSVTGGVRLLTVRRRLRGRKPGAMAVSWWSPSARLATSLFCTACPSTCT